MNLNDLLHSYSRDSRIIEFRQRLSDQTRYIRLKNLFGSSPAFIFSSVSDAVEGLHIFILPDQEQAAYFFNDLENVCQNKMPVYFPSSFKKDVPGEDVDPAKVQARAEALIKLRKQAGKCVLVTYPEAIAEKVPLRKVIDHNIIELRTGEQMSTEELMQFLFALHFTRTDFVTRPGQFALRGGIMDVFSYANDQPFRISFAGNTIESIREFETLSQLSVKFVSYLTILPDVGESKETNETGFLTDFVTEQQFLWIKDAGDLHATITHFYESITKTQHKKQSENQTSEETADIHAFVSPKELSDKLSPFSQIQFGTRFTTEDFAEIKFDIVPQPSFNKNFTMLSEHLADNRKKGMQSLVFADSAKQSERIYAIFEDLMARKQIPHAPAGTVLFTPLLLPLHEGFIDENVKVACYTDHQIFNRYHRYRLKQAFNSSQAITLKELSELKPGDYVTHIDHGIGKYGGLEKIEANGKPQEAIRLIYKDNDILYISIHSLHRIAKYSGKEGEVPAMNKLGSNAWANLKQKTKKKVKDIARELILLYAKRKAQKGYAFAPDTYLQTELEASFIYEDTPDQLKATVDIKKDMESASPMDRLICGDVGFGKTEIAIRAAFKAACDGKQVAVLVPTTILAQQHYNTFSERLKEFPCTVDYINRFKSAKQQTETIKKLEAGKTDIIIGTHRLLNKEIKFKELGLLVIDEEQKFGVASKEKIKEMKVNVDTLTLTATPIPRTLQFSMMGARDLSIINTPPPNRFPVTTELHSFHEDIIRDAVNYELQRGGQVFFVHNRVQNIHEMAEMIRRVCKGANVAVGHGQMDGSQLEDIMLRFISGEYDVLVSTTIIESGLDIPNANTIIINAAQHFGLSDLHQMRGRVGRSNKKAFCYLLTPPLSVLTAQARQRLKAIEEFSDLGSGIHIAMRDLDIRGAGNLLGGEQSGFITELGFETYHKILDEAIAELKQSDFKELFKETNNGKFVEDCVIESDLEILIPDSYVENITERLNLYKSLDEIKEESLLEIYSKNLEDRFGPIPWQVSDLINTIRLRWIAGALGFEKVVLKNKKMVCYFISNPDSEYYKSDSFMNLIRYIQQKKKARMREDKNKLSLTFDLITKVNEANQVLQELQLHSLITLPTK